VVVEEKVLLEPQLVAQVAVEEIVIKKVALELLIKDSMVDFVESMLMLRLVAVVLVLLV
jgi:hypothetical protein